MSDALAISAVSAVLQYYLFNMYSPLSAQFGGIVAVTSQAPDVVQSPFNLGTSPIPAENQVNLFMHQVTYNAAWRNVDQPSVAADGKTRLKSPPLAIDLHYLLTAYGSADWQAEGLLGYALMFLHENSLLTRSDISFALTHLSATFTNNLSSALATSALADQVELLKITPATLGREEMAWLWTALKADYRPTFPFLVSVILMQPDQTRSLALPVLQRAIQAVPIQPAQILDVQPPNGQPAALFTDIITVTGEFLSQVSQVTLTLARYAIRFPVPVIPFPTSTTLTFIAGQQTTYPAGVPPGFYNLVAQFTDASGNVTQSTNALPVALAPTFLTQTATTVHNVDLTTTVTVNFTPAVWEGQNVSLTLSAIPPPVSPNPYVMTVPAQPFTGNANTSLSFVFPPGLPIGPLLGRLQVDGATSPVQVNTAVNPPVFTGPMVTIV
jgi:Pvc16 N-terminal domain